jgi:hypothetical protein
VGRELRRVPANWEHPRDEQGEYIPLHDQCYAAALRDWNHQAELWERRAHPDQTRYPDAPDQYTWEQWHGAGPDPAYYRERCWGEDEATAYQVYENVTEGTPISPVLPDLEALRAWLRADGYSAEATEQLLQTSYLPTFRTLLPDQ